MPDASADMLSSLEVWKLQTTVSYRHAIVVFQRL